MVVGVAVCPLATDGVDAVILAFGDGGTVCWSRTSQDGSSVIVGAPYTVTF